MRAILERAAYTVCLPSFHFYVTVCFALTRSKPLSGGGCDMSIATRSIHGNNLLS